NYVTKSLTDVAVPDAGLDIDQTLLKAITFPSTLAGIVYNAQSSPAAPVSGARITLRGPANVSAATDESGTFLFPALLAGYYTVATSREGYESTVMATVVP